MTRYAETTDFARLGLPAAATTGIATASLNAALDAFGAVIGGYLQARGYTLPLTSWGDDLRRCNCLGAAWDVLRVRGYDPQANSDEAGDVGNVRHHQCANLFGNRGDAFKINHARIG